jgi:hypothetical protein
MDQALRIATYPAVKRNDSRESPRYISVRSRWS